MSLYEKLVSYTESDVLPMHMPGHKRKPAFSGALPYSLDITEIEGFDNLHNRTGILKELADRMAELRHASAAFPVVGGSTAAILSAIWAMTKPGDTVIMARNCHKSVYHAAEIRNLSVVYIYPEKDSDFGFDLSVSPESVEQAFKENPEAKLVIITSPTYEGIVSDIRTIADIAHGNGALLFVDAAHGAHLGYGCSFPADALSRGADAVAESLHKMLPAMTMSSVLYLNEGLDPVEFEKALDIFETSSPSYVILASIDRCVSLLENRSVELFARHRKDLNTFRELVSGLSSISVPGYTEPVGAFALDSSKIIISAARAGVSGNEIAELLREKYRIEPEMVCRERVLCITSVCDTQEDLARLAGALTEIDAAISPDGRKIEPVDVSRVQVAMSVNEALSSKGEYVPAEQSSGRISMTYLWAYPPGIPMVVPGEVVTEEILNSIKEMKKYGVCVQASGAADTREILVKSEIEK